MQNLSLSQKQLQKLSPQQIQLMRLLQVSTMALDQRIEQELEENPALEITAEEELPTEADATDGDADPDEDMSRDTSDFDINDYLDEDDVATYKLKADNHSPDDEVREIPLSNSAGFQEILQDQLNLLKLDDQQRLIGETIIGNLDANGYLMRQIDAMINDLAFSQNIECSEAEIETVLQRVQSLDPPGIAARNLQECLILQIDRLDPALPPVALARILLSQGFDDFSNRRYDRIQTRFNLSEAQLKEAVDLISTLNPRPGNLYGNAVRSPHIIPDFTVYTQNGQIEITLNQRNAPDLHISRSYTEMLETYAVSKQKSRQQHDAVRFITHKIDAARGFIDAIKQRQHTLTVCMQAIANLQTDYLLSGDIADLKPMRMQDVADQVGMDVSTISRVVNSKYVQTPFGTILLREFFSNAVNAESGDDTTAAEVKSKLSDLIAAEEKSKPLTDDQLTDLLAAVGFKLARRTVAKYREALGLPVARLRRSL